MPSLTGFSVSVPCPKRMCSAAHAFPQLSPTDNTPQILIRKSQRVFGAKVITANSARLALNLSPWKIPLLPTFLVPITPAGIFVVAYGF